MTSTLINIPAATTYAPASNQTSTVPQIGSILYMASYLFQLALSSEITPPDTPNMYSGRLEIMGDPGAIDLSPLMGPQGFPGDASFALRRQDTPVVNSIDELPTNLTDTTTDIGKYWQIATITGGVITAVWSYVWYGDSWRVLQIGTFGPPGPTPEISVACEAIPPQKLPTYPDTTSIVQTSGDALDPSWIFQLAVPAGPPGPVAAVATFPDVDETNIAVMDVLAFSGHYTDQAKPIFKPFSLTGYACQFYSVPQSIFQSYSGFAQQAFIGSYALPPQNFEWTPIVWGHIGEGGAMLSTSPFTVGCQVLLGSDTMNTGSNPNAGQLIARGIGNTLGEVNIVPHYSYSPYTGTTLTPENGVAVVPAQHTGDEGTIFLNLWNDGLYGAYNFQPTNAQLFVLVVPVDLAASIQPW